MRRGIKFMLLSVAMIATGSIVAQPVPPKYETHTTPNTVKITANNSDNSSSDLAGGVFFAKEGDNEYYTLFDITGKRIAENLDVYSGRFANRFLPVFYDEVATVHPDGKDGGLIDKTGKIKTITNCSAISSRFIDGMATVIIFTPPSAGRYNKAPEFRYIDKLGNTIYPLLKQKIDSYTDIQEPHPFVDGLSCYYDYTKNRYGYFDKTGKIVIPAQFAEASDFSEGLAVVTKDAEGTDQRWGYINTSGEYVIDPIFHNKPGNFHDGYAVAIKQNGRYVYIDKSGKPCSKEYSKAKRFMNGYAFVSPSTSNFDFDVIDTSLKTVKSVLIKGVGCNISNGQYNEDNSTIFIRGDNRLFTHDGTYLLDLYGNVGKFHGDYASYSNGFINKQGEWIIKFVESEF